MKNLTNPTLTEVKKTGKALTVKQRAFLKLYFETGNATRAALKVYNTKDVANAASIASENLQKLKGHIQIYMEMKGLDLGSLVEKLQEGLEATRTTNAAILLTQDGKTIKSEEQGLIETPDFLARHKYLETAGKWLAIEKTSNMQVVNVNTEQPIPIVPIMGNMIAYSDFTDHKDQSVDEASVIENQHSEEPQQAEIIEEQPAEIEEEPIEPPVKTSPTLAKMMRQKRRNEIY